MPSLTAAPGSICPTLHSQPVQAPLLPALAEPAARTRLAELGAERLVGNTPAEAQRFVAAEMAKWAVILREAGVRAS